MVYKHRRGNFLNYKIGQQLDVTIKKIVPNGLGMAFAEELTVFVPLSAIGDEIRVEIRDLKGRTAFARIEEILTPSPDRVSPVCQFYGKCGGCDFQHLSYEAQLTAKREMIRDCFGRIGKIDWEGEITMVGSPVQIDYRLRAQWHADTQAKKVGYFGRQSHEIIETNDCPVLVPELRTKLNSLRETLEWNLFFEREINIEAAAGDNEKTSVYSPELVEPTGELSIEALGRKYHFNARSFFQGNRFMIEKLITEAVGGLEGRAALDLYCGVGLFSLPLAEKFLRVTGIEDNEASIRFAKRNAEIAKFENIQFIETRVKTALREARGAKEYYDLVLLDPPRSGAKTEIINQIGKLAPRKVSYVSCNPSTLARDLKDLINFGYEIDSVTGIDLFPQTHHIETVVRMSLLN